MAPKWIPDFDYAIDLMEKEHGRWNAEIRVAEALNDQLSQKVWVLPNLRYTVEKKNRATLSLEMDFLIAWKGKGFLILEVKGGDVRFDPKTKRWGTSRSASGESYRSPVKQVLGSRFDFCKMLERFLPQEVNASSIVETAIVLADIESLKDKDGNIIRYIDDYPVSKVLFRPDLNNLGAEVEKFLTPSSELAQQLDPRIMARVVGHFRPTACGNIKPEHILSETECAIDQVTDEQLDHIKMLGRNEFVLLSGPAGTGKTIMGLSLVDAWKKSGRDAFYVTKNRYLVEGLQNDPRFQDVKKRILTLLEFVQLMAGQKSIPDDTNSMSTALMGIEKESRHFSVVLDEAQDLERELYEHLVGLAPFERLWVLIDPYQVLKKKIPTEEYRIECMKNAVRCEVEKNCRNVRKIAESVKDLVTLPSDYIWEKMVHGKKAPDIKKAQSETEHDEKLSETFSRYYSRGYPEPKIVLISCLSGGRDAVQKKYCTEESSFTMGGRAFKYGVNYDSAPRVIWVNDFRGLEADIVIVSDITGEESSFRAHYMSATRAKIELTVIHIDPPATSEQPPDLAPGIEFDL